MKLKSNIVAVILIFSFTGLFANKVDTQAYQKVYLQQEEAESESEKILESEFISKGDKKQLRQKIEYITENKNSQTRKKIKSEINEENKLILKIKENINEEEAKVASEEIEEIISDLDMLNEKVQESFFSKKDVLKVTSLKENAIGLSETDKVVPIRELKKKLTESTIEIEENHQEIISLVNSLKELDVEIENLSTKKYLLKNDKKDLLAIQKQNAPYYKSADDIATLVSLNRSSKEKVSDLTKKQQFTHEDFEKYGNQVNKIIEETNDLLENGNLNKSEEIELNKMNQKLNDLLKLRDYEPGDLAEQSVIAAKSYETHLDSSNERIAEEKRLEAKKIAAEKQALERVEAQRESEEQSQLNQSGELTLVGQWYQAPIGYKFLKGDSGKTYGQVKNPNNFQMITSGEAANYSPGRGNGSAKQ